MSLDMSFERTTFRVRSLSHRVSRMIKLVEIIQAAVEFDDSVPPVVGLDEYFAGNTQEDCIAPNQVGYGRPSLAAMYEVFRAIQSRADVQAVLVGIHDDWIEARDCPDVWPAAENVHILTSASRSEVEKWIEGLAADGIVKGWPYGKHPLAPEPAAGCVVFTVCWD